jgi:hypothetical protein
MVATMPIPTRDHKTECRGLKWRGSIWVGERAAVTAKG